MELLIVVIIPIVFMLAGVTFIVVSQLLGFFQFAQYYRRARFQNILTTNFMTQLASADRLLFNRAVELQALGRQLSLSNEELGRLNNLKSKFLSMVVHDMRNPMSVIQGFADMASGSTENPAKVKEYLSYVMSSAKEVNTLMLDLTDLAVIEAGKLLIEAADMDLRTLISDLAPSYAFLASRRRLVFEVSNSSHPVWVHADKPRLARVCSNLLANAFKFTPDGERVELSLKREGRWAVIRVKDSGMGIEKSELGKVFQKFYQSQQLSAKTRQAGWGLGLSIASEIVALHQGEIGVESEGLGRGATFWVKIRVIQGAKS